MKSSHVDDVRAFNRFYTGVIGLLNQHLLDSPYSLAEARIIFEVFHGKCIQASQITTSMHIDKSYLSRLLKKLERSKIIVKRRSEEDARVFLLALTEKGVGEYHALNRASNQLIGELLAPLSEGQKNDLVSHMEAIKDILNSGKSDGSDQDDR